MCNYIFPSSWKNGYDHLVWQAPWIPVKGGRELVRGQVLTPEDG